MGSIEAERLRGSIMKMALTTDEIVESLRDEATVKQLVALYNVQTMAGSLLAVTTTETARHLERVATATRRLLKENGVAFVEGKLINEVEA